MGSRRSWERRNLGSCGKAAEAGAGIAGRGSGNAEQDNPASAH